MGEFCLGNDYFHEYYKRWMDVNKKGTVAEITFQKYVIAHKRLREIVPYLKLSELNKYEYQQIINKYSETHERQTIIDFHHQIKASIIDALSDGLIDKNPTMRTKIPQGKKATYTHDKFWDVEEYDKFLKFLYTKKDIKRDDFILLLIAKTGIRFGEAIGVCPEDFDFENFKLSINKTWDYKSDSGKFQPTKNFSSNRQVLIDFQTSVIFKSFVSEKKSEHPIFIESGRKIYNSSVNHTLFKYCKILGLKKISIHSLRHTYASVMLTHGVSVESIAKYLGHSDTTVTRKVYLHLTKEMAGKDDDKLIRVLNKF